VWWGLLRMGKGKILIKISFNDISTFNNHLNDFSEINSPKTYNNGKIN